METKRNRKKKKQPKGKEKRKQGKQKKASLTILSRRTTWLDENEEEAFEDVISFQPDEDLDDQEMDMPADVADDDDMDEEDSYLPMKSVVGCSIFQKSQMIRYACTFQRLDVFHC